MLTKAPQQRHSGRVSGPPMVADTKGHAIRVGAIICDGGSGSIGVVTEVRPIAVVYRTLSDDEMPGVYPAGEAQPEAWTYPHQVIVLRDAPEVHHG